MVMANRCTCRSGRDTDGSEFGPCEFCEQEHDREIQALEDRERLDWLEAQGDRRLTSGWHYHPETRDGKAVLHNGFSHSACLTVREAIDCARFPERAPAIYDRAWKRDTERRHAVEPDRNKP